MLPNHLIVIFKSYKDAWVSQLGQADAKKKCQDMALYYFDELKVNGEPTDGFTQEHYDNVLVQIDEIYG